jgi:hypothetical protein
MMGHKGSVMKCCRYANRPNKSVIFVKKANEIFMDGDVERPNHCYIGLCLD